MKRGEENGSTLLGLLVVFFLGVAILLSMKIAISRYILQEGMQRSVWGEYVQYNNALRQPIRDPGTEISWDVIGVEDNCRVFSVGEWRDLVGDEIRGRKLSEACLRGSSRQLLGFQVVDDLSDSKKSIYALYVLEKLSPALSLRVSDWEVGRGSEGIEVDVFYEGDQYLYFIGDMEFDWREGEGGLIVLQNASPDGFLFFKRDELWLLPIDQEVPVFLNNMGFLAQTLLADYWGERGLYLLREDDELGVKEVVVDFYPKLSDGVGFGRAERLMRLAVEFDLYEVLVVDPYKAIIRLEVNGNSRLLATKWDGSVVWGKDYLWESKKHLDCPLQSEVFEPVDGWRLGCQRATEAHKITLY
ncbi:hypothetical protein [Ignatzschineria sp. LJL83]